MTTVTSPLICVEQVVTIGCNVQRVILSIFAPANFLYGRVNPGGRALRILQYFFMAFGVKLLTDFFYHLWRHMILAQSL